MSNSNFNTAVTIALVGQNKFKPYEELDLSDDFMFGKVMQDKKRCKKLLEITLHIDPDTEIEEPVTQGNIRNSPGGKSVFLDVRTSDNSSFYDAEMQNRVDDSLPLRMRYYQAMMDIEFLQKGHEYGELMKNYILFFCKTDLFHKKKPVYTFTNKCEEEENLEFGDKTTKIVYNASKWADVKDKELSALLRMIYEGKPSTDYTTEIDGFIQDQRINPLWRKEYMDFHMQILHEKNIARKEALAEGEVLGAMKTKVETAKNLLSMNILTPEQIAQASGLSLEEVQEIKLSENL